MKGDLQQELAKSDVVGLTDHNWQSTSTSNTDLPVYISIVSDSPILREGLLALLKTHLVFHLVGSYGSNVDLNDALPNPPGHLVLLDSGIGRERALAVIRGCRALSSAALVIVMELSNDTELILECITAGASGFTLKGSSARELADTIHFARQGMAYCSPEITASLFERLASLGSPELNLSRLSITPREMEILKCLARGHSNKEIAQELVIEVRTVKHHVHNILNKLQVRHRWDAAHFARQQGWFNTDDPSNQRTYNHG